MSNSDPLHINDISSFFESASKRIYEDARTLIEQENASQVSDEAVARLLTAAVRLYAAKTDGEDRTFRPLTGNRDETVTATELLTAVSELLRALNLGPMELALWYRQRPDGEEH